MFQQVHVSMAARRQLVIHVILPLAYIICGRFGLLLAVPPGYATAVFLPAGIAVGGMFIAGAATLSGTFVGSFLLNMWIGYSIAHRLDATGIAAALVIAFASMLQAAVGGTALRRLIGYPTPLDTGRDLLLVLLLSPIFCVTSATLSLSGMWALGVVEPAHLIIKDDMVGGRHARGARGPTPDACARGPAAKVVAFSRSLRCCSNAPLLRPVRRHLCARDEVGT
jgi:integral membrane sensor domain MASE1